MRQSPVFSPAQDASASSRQPAAAGGRQQAASRQQAAGSRQPAAAAAAGSRQPAAGNQQQQTPRVVEAGKSNGTGDRKPVTCHRAWFQEKSFLKNREEQRDR